MFKESRRLFLKEILGVGGLFCLFSFAESADSAEERLSAENLKADLYASNKKEEDYIDDICVQRKKKKIPEKLIVTAYKYAMKKKKVVRMTYFAKCLAWLCQKEGIKVNFLKF